MIGDSSKHFEAIFNETWHVDLWALNLLILTKFSCFLIVCAGIIRHLCFRKCKLVFGSKGKSRIFLIFSYNMLKFRLTTLYQSNLRTEDDVEH